MDVHGYQNKSQAEYDRLNAEQAEYYRRNPSALAMLGPKTGSPGRAAGPSDSSYYQSTFAGHYVPPQR
jgi:hypothetical protein